MRRDSSDHSHPKHLLWPGGRAWVPAQAGRRRLGQ